ncbi:MAG: UvrD-helicase domain-containing protein [Wenzhouxiangella sp.]|nr:UvrD-helicase domain-containing protein [Wenzhouxiangella sp.]MCH8478059.1 UvrD-helicase domain-containing protein [Wenzhouxiangella sp.]TVR95744.1 MAG: ATP-dependent DNA helicase Rep [Wenzhouxiangellaceae bacterium]
MSGLNDQQRAAVTHIDSPLLVLAGAGSGKTRVITEKIAWLIDRGHYPAREIAAITFTNKAAKEMRKRVSARLKKRNAEGLTICTFHSLGWQILREDPDACQRRKGLSIIDQHTSSDLVRELLPTGAKNDLIYAIQAAIGRFKDAGLDPAQALAQATDENMAKAADIYRDYSDRLAALNAVDFDDLIALPAQMLKDPVIRTRWRRRLAYLLVDEYQDTSAAQYRLLRELIGDVGAMTAVGDDDQSIYGWRGARPENINGLKVDYPGLTVIKLEQNYRSTGMILTAANAVIACNPHEYEKALWSDLGPGDRISVAEHNDDSDEAEAIARDILGAYHGGRARWGDCAVLYRSNQQARAIELQLREHGIPYLVSGGPSWFDAREIRDGLSYLRVLVNPDDNPAFMRVANTPRRGLGSTAMARLARYAEATGKSLFEAGLDPMFQNELPQASARALRSFTNLLVDFTDRASRDGIGQSYRELLDHIGYIAWLGEQDDEPRRTERRARNLNDLTGWIERLEADVKSPDELLARVALVAGPDDDRNDGADLVRLMTLHAAKGLEFPRVWLAGCEEGLLPHQRSIDDGQVEEERRLMYVGITRAQRTLTISYCRSRKRQRDSQSCTPSRFLDELPESTIDWPARHGRIETTKEDAQANIAALKAMLEG